MTIPEVPSTWTMRAFGKPMSVGMDRGLEDEKEVRTMIRGP